MFKVVLIIIAKQKAKIQKRGEKQTLGLNFLGFKCSAFSATLQGRYILFV